MSEYPGKLQVRCATCRLLRNPGETLARRKRKIKGRGRPGDIRNARPGRTLNVTVASVVDVEPHMLTWHHKRCECRRKTVDLKSQVVGSLRLYIQLVSGRGSSS
jgi:hypothetical protein